MVVFCSLYILILHWAEKILFADVIMMLKKSPIHWSRSDVVRIVTSERYSSTYQSNFHRVEVTHHHVSPHYLYRSNGMLLQNHCLDDTLTTHFTLRCLPHNKEKKLTSEVQHQKIYIPIFFMEIRATLEVMRSITYSGTVYWVGPNPRRDMASRHSIRL